MWWEEEAEVQCSLEEAAGKLAGAARDATWNVRQTLLGRGAALQGTSLAAPAPLTPTHADIYCVRFILIPCTLQDFMVSAAGEAVGVAVRGGVYEVDLPLRLLRPSFWPATKHRVLRGSWFAEKAPGDWVPLKVRSFEEKTPSPSIGEPTTNKHHPPASSFSLPGLPARFAGIPGGAAGGGVQV
jgi:hypothetical protein